ncbi:MAG: hypothetical protein ABIM57_06450, partial [candidate division WOR-3 bacterium]
MLEALKNSCGVRELYISIITQKTHKVMLMLKDLKRTIQEHFVGGTSENLIEPEKFNVNPINL